MQMNNVDGCLHENISNENADKWRTSRSVQDEIPELPWSPLPSSWARANWQPYNRCVAKPSRQRSLEVPTKDLQEYSNQKQPKAFCHLKVNGLNLAKHFSSLPPARYSNSETITLPAIFLEWLTGTRDENIWKHQDGSGCIVHVQPPEDTSVINRQVILIGTSRAREIAAKYLNDLCLSDMKTYHSNARRHDSIKHDKQHSNSEELAAVRVDQLPLPTSWNLRSFAEYIKLITNARSPKSIERELYPKDGNFNKAAAEVLIELFTDHNLRACQSSLALRYALKFCSRRTDIAYAARSIWKEAKLAGIVPDVSCFNYEISRYIRVGNRTSIVRLWHEMKETHIRPNSETWALFFRLLDTEQEQYSFLKIPIIRDTLHDQFTQEIVVQGLIKTTFKPSDDRPDSVMKFEERMNEKFGSRWLTPTTIQRMIKKCTQSGASLMISRVLTVAAKMPYELDIDSSTALIEAVAKTGHFEDVLLLLKLQPSNTDPILVQKRIELVFREAWRHRLVNTARVLWHYAATHGIIENMTLRKISKELTQSVHPATGPSRSTAWMAAAIIGTDRSHAVKSRSSSSEDNVTAVLDAISGLSQWQPDGEIRHNQLQKAHVLLQRDLTAWQRYKAMEYTQFMATLNEAFKLDMVWQKTSKMSSSTPADLVRETIRINLEPLEPQPGDDAIDITISNAINAAKGFEKVTNTKITQNPALEHETLSPWEQKHHCGNEDVHRFQLLGFQNLHCVSHLRSSCPSPGILVAPTLGIPIVDFLLHYLGLAWTNR